MSNLYKNLPDSPGVYLMKDIDNQILYIGKAGNLRWRVSSYFLPASPARFAGVLARRAGERPHDLRLEKLISQIKKIDYRTTDTAIEALILEANLIKKYEPPFNIREKDDKSFLYVEITKEDFPRVLLVRGKSLISGERFGPFTSAGSVREALKIIRRIFPFSTHFNPKIGKSPESKMDHNKRACFDYEIGLCSGTCIEAISRKDYLKIIKNTELFFLGKKKRILKNLEKEMEGASKKLEFEKAEKIRRQIFSLRHIQDTALITDNLHLRISNISSYRIEGYDISNISGASAVGSMVVFINGVPVKDQYKKFRIRSIVGPNDTAMLKEVLRRRLRHAEWPLPNLFLIDGGLPQVNTACQILFELGLKISVVGIAKGPTRKKNEFILRPDSLQVSSIFSKVDQKTLIKVRDEAHRFAVSYHRQLRGKRFLDKPSF